MNKIYYWGFSVSSISGILISLSGSSALGVWLGLEVSLLSFIPMILDGSEAEAPLKYFLVQAWASLLVLAGLISFELSGLTLCGLLVKLGAAPFYSWYPSTVSSFSWGNNLFIATVLKIAPLSLFVLWSTKGWSSSAGLAGCLVGALFGLGETCLRKLLAFSSVSHLGWTLLASSEGGSLWCFYFMTYVVLTSVVVLLFASKHIFYIKEARATSSELSMVMGLLSLGGLPPLLGFYPKWIVVSSLASEAPALVGGATLLSVVSLYYYLNVAVTGGALGVSGPRNSAKKDSSYFLVAVSGGGGVAWGASLLL